MAHFWSDREEEFRQICTVRNTTLIGDYDCTPKGRVTLECNTCGNHISVAFRGMIDKRSRETIVKCSNCIKIASDKKKDISIDTIVKEIKQFIDDNNLQVPINAPEYDILATQIS